MQEPINRQIESISKSITIKDIAKKAGVSIGTVDRALHDRGRISAETKKKVLDAIEELGYQPNKFAQSLRKQKEIRILALFQEEPQTYSVHFVNGFREMQEDLSNYGVHLDILRARTLGPADMANVFETIDFENYDGILLNAGGPELDRYIDFVIEKGIAVATFNSDAPSSSRLFFVGENHYCAGRLAGELTAKLLKGKGTVSFFSGLETVYALSERTRGFRDVIKEYYPDVQIINEISHYDNLAIREEKAEELLFGGQMPDAVFCNTALGAFPVCQLLKRSKVKSRPIVIGYDEDEALEKMVKEGYCTAIMHQHPERQARNALRFIFEYIYYNHRMPLQEETRIMPTIVMRENLRL